MGERTVGKAERLLQIEHPLLAHPAGLTQAEIARRTGVNRSTISRSLPELTSRFAVYETDDGRLAIGRFREAVRGGIGPAKAFGCGLLSLARA